MKRKQIMDRVKELARAEHDRGDCVMSTQYADTWYELATEAEAKRAPLYLTWRGRSRKH